MRTHGNEADCYAITALTNPGLYGNLTLPCDWQEICWQALFSCNRYVCINWCSCLCGCAQTRISAVTHGRFCDLKPLFTLHVYLLINALYVIHETPNIVSYVCNLLKIGALLYGKSSYAHSVAKSLLKAGPLAKVHVSRHPLPSAKLSSFFEKGNISFVGVFKVSVKTWWFMTILIIFVLVCSFTHYWVGCYIPFC